MTAQQRRYRRLSYWLSWTCFLLLCTITSSSNTASLEDLKNLKTKFYIYEEYEISHELTLSLKRQRQDAELSKNCTYLDHVLKAAKSERILLEALQRHHLRTRDPNEAELYIVPTPISELFAYQCQDESCTSYDKSFDALRHHEWFRKMHGHNHILLSYGLYFFKPQYACFVASLSRHYPILSNVTIASYYYDDSSLSRSSLMAAPVTKRFSTGLYLDAPFDIQEPTDERYTKSKYMLFYHKNTSSTVEPSFLIQQLQQDPPLELSKSIHSNQSSLEHDLPQDEWQRRLLSSNFCLILRGDAPHENPLLYAIRAGCLPVIVNDAFQETLGPFRSSLEMKDFGFFIPETDFIQDPNQAIATVLNGATEATLKTKLQNLALAQSVLLVDHPNSLFVEAFLKEAAVASQAQQTGATQQNEIVEMRHGQAVVSSKTLTYRYPTTMTKPIESSSELKIVFGVLSNAAKPNARHAIRTTWATTGHARVVFLVSGLWDDIRQEFYEFGDLLWIDMPEEYLLLTYKSQVFFTAVDTLVKDYDYIFKTDDDSFIGVEEVSRILSQYQPDYWGKCMTEKQRLVKRDDPDFAWYTSKALYPEDRFPPYASGFGHALSRKFVQCAVSKIPTQTSYLPWEDAATGLLARACHVPCRNEEMLDEQQDYEQDYMAAPTTTLRTVQHYVLTSAEMRTIHWEELEKKQQQQIKMTES